MGLFSSLFAKDPHSMDSTTLFNNANYWSKNKTRPDWSSLPETIYISTDFSKALKDLQWAVEHDGSSHMVGVYGCGDDYFFTSQVSGVRGPLFSYQFSFGGRWDADPSSWRNITRVASTDGNEVYKKTIEKSRMPDYKILSPLGRIIASAPSIDPTTNKSINYFFSINELKNACFQNIRSFTCLLTEYVYLVIPTQQTILNEEVLADKTYSMTKRLNALHIAIYKGKIEEGKLVKITDI